MGIIACGIVIDGLPKINESNVLDQKRLKTKFQKSHTTNLSPKDLHIIFHNNCTVILLDMIFYQNISEEAELTELEKDIYRIFPGSYFMIFVLNDMVDFHGYSMIDEEGKKIRTKAVVRDEIFLDFGDLNKYERVLYDTFINSLEKYPNSKKYVNDAFSSLPNSEKEKACLKFRDAVQLKYSSEVKMGYNNGTLDSYIIEKEFKLITGLHLLDLEQLEGIQFQRRKLNFKKDSLIEFLYIAKEQLL